MDNQSYIQKIQELKENDKLIPIQYIVKTLVQNRKDVKVYYIDSSNINSTCIISDSSSNDIVILQEFNEYIFTRILKENFKGYILVKNCIDHPDYYQTIIKLRLDHQNNLFYCTLWDANVGVFRYEFNQYMTPYNIYYEDISLQDLSDRFCEYMNPIDTNNFLIPYQSSNRYKYSVLTCLFNRYEINIREPEEYDPDVEYVMVTDDPELLKLNTIWKIVLMDNTMDPCGPYAKVIYVKYHPFDFVSSNVVLWLDGSVVLRKNVTKMVMNPFINSNAELLELSNLVTSDTVWEMNRWLENKFHNFDQGMYDESLKFFQNEQDVRRGMYQTTVYACKNTRLVNMINTKTADLIQWCRNGQSSSYICMPHRSWILNKYVLGSDKLMIMDRYELFGEYFTYCDHGTNISQEEGWRVLGHDINHDPKKEVFTSFKNRVLKLIKFYKHE